MVIRRSPHLFTMPWPDQNPPATDIVLHLNVPCAGGSPAYLEIDKLPDGTYRATVGTLFEHQEICRTRELETLIRHANAMAGVDPSVSCRRVPSDADARLNYAKAHIRKGRRL